MKMFFVQSLFSVAVLELDPGEGYHLKRFSIMMGYRIKGIYIFIIILKFFIIYFWLHWVFVAVHGLFLVAMSRGYSSSQYTSFSIEVASVIVEHRL